MKSVTCNLCDRDDWQVRFPATLNGAASPDVSAFRCTSAGYGYHPRIVQCRHCGYVYANPRWEPEELLGAYSAVEDEVYLQEWRGRELTFRKHLKRLAKFAGAANGRPLLDIGAYIGVFVDVARASGWDAIGVEPSAWAVAVARKRDLPVIQGTQDAQELQGRSFDVVTMWDVIEHVDDPAAELRKVFALLKPGGLVAVHTMNIDSRAALLLGERWPWLMAMHIHYFSEKTLARMLSEIGFEVIWSGAQGRYLRLGYLVSRVGGMSALAGRIAGGIVSRLSLSEAAIPVNFGDLFTMFARRPPSSEV